MLTESESSRIISCPEVRGTDVQNAVQRNRRHRLGIAIDDSLRLAYSMEGGASFNGLGRGVRLSLHITSIATAASHLESQA